MQQTLDQLSLKHVLCDMRQRCETVLTLFSFGHENIVVLGSENSIDSPFLFCEKLLTLKYKTRSHGWYSRSPDSIRRTYQAQTMG